MNTSCHTPPKRHQTTRIRNNQDLHQLCYVAIAVATHYLDVTWVIRKNEGSLTLQNPEDLSEVVTVFKDYDNHLANAAGLRLYEHPVAVAIELCRQAKFARDCMRTELKKRYEQLYLDGEYYLSPQQEHHFDIVLLPEGPCADVDETACNSLIELFSSERNSHEIKVSDLCKSDGSS